MGSIMNILFKKIKDFQIESFRSVFGKHRKTEDRKQFQIQKENPAVSLVLSFWVILYCTASLYIYQIYLHLVWQSIWMLRIA